MRGQSPSHCGLECGPSVVRWKTPLDRTLQVTRIVANLPEIVSRTGLQKASWCLSSARVLVLSSQACWSSAPNTQPSYPVEQGCVVASATEVGTSPKMALCAHNQDGPMVYSTFTEDHSATLFPTKQLSPIMKATHSKELPSCMYVQPASAVP